MAMWRSRGLGFGIPIANPRNAHMVISATSGPCGRHAVVAHDPAEFSEQTLHERRIALV